MTAPIVVMAAVIERDGHFLMTRRLKGTHLEGKWEFPGGKCEPGEAHDACLARELREELAVRCEIGEEVFTVEHAYPERTVRLHFHRATLLGEPSPQQGQEMRWIDRGKLRSLELPEADQGLVDLLTR
ncbi:MAG TPA: (deoxy)nucleoside triphosphate pyrophosphohydrolase [Vicinamibacterales bacterium]|nr:(deoxy)nucleoside triphosphate pyrophosphohydrolase [Vicinamibacterales bacterium]